MEVLRDKNIFLTGGTAGIGKATTLFLAEKGYKVFIVGRNSEKLEQLMEEARSAGVEDRIKFLLQDLADYEAWEKILPNLWDVHGPFHILINNAGIGFAGISDADAESLVYMTKTNLDAYLLLAGFFAKKMKEEDIEGDIINIGSMSADDRGGSSTGYVATKAGIQGFTESLRKEVNPDNIRVSLIEPAAVGTDMQKISAEEQAEKEENREMLKAEDLAKLIHFILEQDRRITFPEIKIKALRQFI